MDESQLAERLITYNTSTLDGIKAACGFIKGWLESNGINVTDRMLGDLPVLTAQVGSDHGATLVLHGHVDVVPGHPDQFTPQIDGDRLIGRGAYDMEGGLAAMMCVLRDVADQDDVCVRFICAPDEEAEDVDVRSTDVLVDNGFIGDFAITGEPTNLHVGVEAKGVLGCRIVVHGRAAHGSTPWPGDNAVLKALEIFRRIGTLPFSRESSELFDRPSINLGRIVGGDVLNMVPDRCIMLIDVRYLPSQNPDLILEQIRAIPDIEVERIFRRPPVSISRQNPYVVKLIEAAAKSAEGETTSVGRDGASDAVSFMRAGVPAVEFGPVGADHHGPNEWVSMQSLKQYRLALVEFIGLIPRLSADKG